MKETGYGLVSNSYNHLSDCMTGKAGEHLVCADLIMMGYNAFPVAEHILGYDIILDIKGRLYKVQVKTTKNAQFMGKESRVPSFGFSILKRGYKSSKGYTSSDVDLYAFVVLETRQIGYYPFSNRSGKVYFRSSIYKGKYWDERCDEAKIKAALLRDRDKSRKLISDELGIPLYAVDRLLYRKIPNNVKGIYFEELTIDRCLKIVNDGNMTDKKVLPLYKQMIEEQKIFITPN